MKYILIAILAPLALFVAPNLASAEEVVAEAQQSEADIVINVKGLVCDFCAQVIGKVFGEEPGIADVAVDLTAKTVSVWLDEGAEISDERLTKLVEDTGYNVASIERVNEAD